MWGFICNGTLFILFFIKYVALSYYMVFLCPLKLIFFFFFLPFCFKLTLNVHPSHAHCCSICSVFKGGMKFGFPFCLFLKIPSSSLHYLSGPFHSSGQKWEIILLLKLQNTIPSFSLPRSQQSPSNCKMFCPGDCIADQVIRK